MTGTAAVFSSGAAAAAGAAGAVGGAPGSAAATGLVAAIGAGALLDRVPPSFWWTSTPVPISAASTVHCTAVTSFSLASSIVLITPSVSLAAAADTPVAATGVPAAASSPAFTVAVSRLAGTG